VERREKVVDAFLDLYNGDARQIYISGINLWSQINTSQSPISRSEFALHVGELLKREDALDLKVEDLWRRFKEFPEIVSDHPDRMKCRGLREKTYRLLDWLGRLSKTDSNDDGWRLVQMESRYTEEWRSALNDFTNCLTDKTTTLGRVRGDLANAK
jgi:hypothetical protein